MIVNDAEILKIFGWISQALGNLIIVDHLELSFTNDVGFQSLDTNRFMLLTQLHQISERKIYDKSA